MRPLSLVISRAVLLVGGSERLKCVSVPRSITKICSWLVWLGLLPWQHTHKIVILIKATQEKLQVVMAMDSEYPCLPLPAVSSVVFLSLSQAFK